MKKSMKMINHVTDQSDSRLFTIWKCDAMRPNPMATLMANCVSKERIEVYVILLFLCYTYFSNRLKNMLEPGGVKIKG